jgi:DNA-directed RNA polymerase III subunit RPC3
MLLKEYINILSSADNPTPSGRSGAFISSPSTGLSGKVQVEFQNVYKKLKLAVLNGYVRERWGPLAVRVVRVLLATGKMDEKQLSKVAMISPDDIRPLISVLSSASIISMHEVPRGKDFVPHRTFYFWFVLSLSFIVYTPTPLFFTSYLSSIISLVLGGIHELLTPVIYASL